MPALPSREWRLTARPVGLPEPGHFALAEAPAPEPGEGEIQIRNRWLSVDPYMRGRMTDRASYVPPFAIGEPMQGGAVGEVVASRHPGYNPGDVISHVMGWREAVTVKPEAALAMKLPSVGLPEQAFLGIAGMPGLTAYAGLKRIGQPKAGETVFVSGAAGAVGSLVCQIAKISGCRVVGSAGGPDKAAWLHELGVDAVIDYKSLPDAHSLVHALREAAPEGIDVYFDNVGGDHLVAALECARVRARFAVCGMISAYNATAMPPGPANIVQIIPKRIRIEGFIVTDHADLMGEFQRDMGQWFAEGRLRWQETTRDRIESAVAAFLGLFAGENLGKMLVRL